jgi:hypothetical protein
LKKNNLINSKGISAIFLIIAMLLMVTIGYVFSYLIPSKQKSVVFPIQSTQAFFIAQSGVEFAVRYATDNNWTSTALLDANLDGVTRGLGAGRFTLAYNYTTNGDTLTSVGEVPTGTPRRSIRISNFTSFLPQGGLVLWIEPGVYQEPCLYLFNYQIRFYIKNTGTSAITLDSFSASWSQPPSNRQLIILSISGTTVYSDLFGGYGSGSGIQGFTTSVTINPNDVMRVILTWSRNIGTNLPVNISLYDNATPSTEYPFTLSPTGNCTY